MTATYDVKVVLSRPEDGLFAAVRLLVDVPDGTDDDVYAKDEEAARSWLLHRVGVEALRPFVNNRTFIVVEEWMRVR